uniref:Uncharacterized protein n=1 Tax=viral metagenome TaxID=1070528 RepID=A0A6H2A444_9ZZZZ
MPWDEVSTFDYEGSNRDMRIGRPVSWWVERAMGKREKRELLERQKVEFFKNGGKIQRET